MNNTFGIEGIEVVNPATWEKHVSPLKGWETTIQRTQGGALRLSPRRSADGLVC